MFSEPIAAESITETSFALSTEDGTPIAGAIDVDGAGVTFTPSAPLDPSSPYRVELTTAIQDLAGNALGEGLRWRFSTRKAGWTTPELLETNQNVAASSLRVAAAAGRIAAVWLTRECAGTLCSGDYGIQAAIYTDGGWLPPDTAVTSAAQIAGPEIALDAAGRATIVWYQTPNVGSTFVYASHRDGSSWSVPERLDREDSGDAMLPKVATDGQGNVFAAWRDGETANVWAARFAVASGWETAVRVEDRADPVANVSLAAGGDTVHLVWYQGGNHYTSRHEGNSWTAPEVLAAGPNVQTKVVVDDSGDAVAIWSSNNGMTGDMLAARYTGTWSQAEVIDDLASVIMSDYDLAVGADGRVAAVWRQGGDLWQAVFTEKDGWGPSFRLETNSGALVGPRVVLGGARGMAVWHQDGGGGNFDLQANEYRNASGWAGPEVVESQTGSVLENAIVYDSVTGSFFTLWVQAPSGFASIYWSQHQ